MDNDNIDNSEQSSGPFFVCGDFMFGVSRARLFMLLNCSLESIEALANTILLNKMFNTGNDDFFSWDWG